jgi:hypothetical protein
MSECLLTDIYDVITTTFPSTIRVLNLSFNNLSSSTWPINSFTNPSMNNVFLRRAGLSSTSVDNIINDIAATVTVSGTLSLGPNAGSSFGQPNGSRTSASDTSYDELIALGWNITLP